MYIGRGYPEVLQGRGTPTKQACRYDAAQTARRNGSYAKENRHLTRIETKNNSVVSTHLIGRWLYIAGAPP